LSLNIVNFPDMPAAMDVPAALRKLADQIEAGEFGGAHNLAWVIDEGDSELSIGLMGKAAAPGAEAHLLFALAQQTIINGIGV